MKELKEILYKVKIIKVIGTTSISVSKLCIDSRKTQANDLFVAIKGNAIDGHQFINKAIDLGAKSIICESIPSNTIDGVTYLQVNCSREALSISSANYFDNPSEKLKLIGVTGTNGKTTIATLLFDLFKSAGFKTGLISTVKICINNNLINSLQTTPDSILINSLLSKMLDNGVEYCFMEISSHGIHQKRINGLNFSGGIFSNLSHDHLDYHSTFSNYRDIKKEFFDNLPKDSFSLINKDDKNGKFMTQNTNSKVYYYALNSYADFKIKILEKSIEGMLLKIDQTELWTNLSGKFNAYNLLSVISAAILLGIPKQKVLEHASLLKSVRGRFEYIIVNDITAIVDYAHTPDALKNVIETINDIRKGNDSLITVVGCGGDRDSVKRPLMGHISSSLSSKVIFTSDNPRSESADLIIEQMNSGVSPIDSNKVISISNREEAIKTACQLASPKDIILIAGKGHETYQEINGKKNHFDDYEIVKNYLTKII
ncbi:UDP-N-acetylmuramoyl-L-alanyl-D-glutamate--2,6-diaminopimelate ligase [Flavobacteriaceae bacterium]|nr:UDP-N-acetylmuramoyl-L-alanyl-D-glutamate--2,6-diaminopimelate ligase [Flavobacteriaceae bacterium]MDB9712409.1 UDP-N-acetylmuramoyl-L-alanyl-D-glutamate--2,6-diaminopimelate ligase [Flavobacteriaceae bacterium]MDC1493104.1 UDP-N-acetylmuramoyl-L-alanyl-D-glutamate--2,6-diaminopimelate ligase [Flavobacteriaceae bacterium]MDC1534924.1 UDP-N-acetylmuramoyl-L-alanyl-D-glutamate--2,6-diaminopimelate ligase [Flavobacteriaceae bacterium]